MTSPPLRRLKLTKLPLDTRWSQLNARDFPSAGMIAHWRALVHNRDISLDDFSRAGEVKELLMESIKLREPLSVIRATSWYDLGQMNIEDFWATLATYFHDDEREVYRKLHRAYKQLGLRRTPQQPDFVQMISIAREDTTPATPTTQSKEDWMAETLKKKGLPGDIYVIPNQMQDIFQMVSYHSY